MSSPPTSPTSESPTIPTPVTAAPRRAPRTLLWTWTTYFGEGLPWSFLHQLTTEFLTTIGAPKREITATSYLHFAVTAKFLWSPLVDLFGRKRTWLVVMQLVLGFGMFVVALVSQSTGRRVLWTILGVLAVLHATHDIACDGFYLQALNRKDQAAYSGVRNAAFRSAMWVGRSGLVVLAGQVGWLWGFGAAGALMIVTAVVNAVVMPNPAEVRPETRADGRRAAGASFLAAYWSFLTQPSAVTVLLFMLFYKLGDIMMFAMATPFLGDLGVSVTTRGVLSTFTIASTIAGSIVGGAIISRFGLRRCLVPMTYLQSLAIPLYIALAVFKPGMIGIVPIAITEQFAAGIGTAAHVVFMMQRSRPSFSASHYAFATAVVSIASALSGAFSGRIYEAVGYPMFFTIAFIASWPSLILVLLVPKTPVDQETKPAEPAPA